MRVQNLICIALAGAAIVIFPGCMTMDMIAPGVSVMDTRTGKEIAHIEDASLYVDAPWGQNDTEARLPGSSTDKGFRTIYSYGELAGEKRTTWRIREFDTNGKEVGKCSLPSLSFAGHRYWDTTVQYAFSPAFDRAVFCHGKSNRVSEANKGGTGVFQKDVDMTWFDNPWSISVYEVNTGETRVLLRDAIMDPSSIQWMRWIDDNNVVLFIGGWDLGAYSGCVVLIPVDTGQPRVLYRHPDAMEAAISPDMSYLAVALSFPPPEPSQLILVDLGNASQQLIGRFDGREVQSFLFHVAWSPDSSTIAYNRGLNVEIYSLEEKKCRVLKQNLSTKTDSLGFGFVYEMHFLDKGRLGYEYSPIVDKRRLLEILDVKTGETLLVRSFNYAGGFQVFDAGNRIAIEGRMEEE